MNNATAPKKDEAVLPEIASVAPEAKKDEACKTAPVAETNKK